MTQEQKIKPKENLITLQKVSKVFKTSAGNFTALEDINLNINKKEFIAITGASGSGKSTLLNMITGIDHPSSGTILFDKQNPHTFDESKLAQWRGKNIGIVFQFFQLIPTLTVLENLLLPMDFIDVIPKKNRNKRALELLAHVGLSNHKDKLPLSLSGGQQQRVAIARALSNDPPIIVADEPTGNLDSKTSEEIYSLFNVLVKKGKTVLVVTHDQTENYHYNQTIVMKDGKISQENRA